MSKTPGQIHYEAVHPDGNWTVLRPVAQLSWENEARRHWPFDTAMDGKGTSFYETALRDVLRYCAARGENMEALAHIEASIESALKGKQYVPLPELPAPPLGRPPLFVQPIEDIHRALTTRYPIGWSMVWSEQTPQGTIETKAMATGSRVEQLGQAVFLDMAVRANTPMRP